jgi:hypothetical protein
MWSNSLGLDGLRDDHFVSTMHPSFYKTGPPSQAWAQFQYFLLKRSVWDVPDSVKSSKENGWFTWAKEYYLGQLQKFCSPFEICKQYLATMNISILLATKAFHRSSSSIENSPWVQVRANLNLRITLRMKEGDYLWTRSIDCIQNQERWIYARPKFVLMRATLEEAQISLRLLTMRFGCKMIPMRYISYEVCEYTSPKRAVLCDLYQQHYNEVLDDLNWNDPPMLSFNCRVVPSTVKNHRYDACQPLNRTDARLLT